MAVLKRNVCFDEESLAALEILMKSLHTENLSYAVRIAIIRQAEIEEGKYPG